VVVDVVVVVEVVVEVEVEVLVPGSEADDEETDELVLPDDVVPWVGVEPPAVVGSLEPVCWAGTAAGDSTSDAGAGSGSRTTAELCGCPRGTEVSPGART
jgi:hypothetical protein